MVGRIAVVADVHGNAPALEAVLAEADREGVELLAPPTSAEAIEHAERLVFSG